MKKDVTKFNAVQHGILSRKLNILPGESRYGFRKLKQKLLAYYDPKTDLEMALVDYLCICFWRLKRALKLEAKVIEDLEKKWEDLERNGIDTPSNFIDFDKLERILRYSKSIERSIFRIQQELRQIDGQKSKKPAPLHPNIEF